jgi:hypothetical protein
MTELDELRQFKTDLEASPYLTMYEGLLKQWNNLAQELKENVSIKIDGEDKAFDRFAKLLEKLNPMIESIEKLRKKIGLEKEVVNAKKINPIEQEARR